MVSLSKTYPNEMDEKDLFPFVWFFVLWAGVYKVPLLGDFPIKTQIPWEVREV